MNEEGKKLEAVGDGLLLACARLYLKEQHSSISYSLYTKIITRMVSNKNLAVIARGEGLAPTAERQDSEADALEILIARRFYQDGFGGMRAWLWSLFDKYMEVEEEARKLLDPTLNDALVRSVQGALRNAMRNNSGKVTEQNIEKAAKQIVAQLQQSSSS